MKTLLAALLICLPVILYAQEKQYTTSNKDAIKSYNKAGQSLDYQLYDQAIDQLTYAVTLDVNFLEAQNQLADVLRLTKKYKQAIEHYLHIIAINPEFNRAVYLNIGQVEVNTADYSNAQLHLAKYLTYTNITAPNKRYAVLLLSDCVFSIQLCNTQHPLSR